MSVISRKNQITLPVQALRAAGLEPGDDVRVQAVGPGRLELIRTEDLPSEFAGVFGPDVYPTAIDAESRGLGDVRVESFDEAILRAFMERKELPPRP